MNIVFTQSSQTYETNKPTVHIRQFQVASWIQIREECPQIAHRHEEQLPRFRPRPVRFVARESYLDCAKEWEREARDNCVEGSEGFCVCLAKEGDTEIELRDTVVGVDGLEEGGGGGAAAIPANYGKRRERGEHGKSEVGRDEGCVGLILKYRWKEEDKNLLASIWSVVRDRETECIRWIILREVLTAMFMVVTAEKSKGQSGWSTLCLFLA
jgi:hypothetical protein